MKRIFYLILLLISSSNLFASHYMGGEITWECLHNRNYRFILKLYRECNGVTYSNPVSLTTNVPGMTSITMNLFPNATLGRKDLSPICKNNPNFPHIKCLPTPSMPNTGALEEWTFTSDAAYPGGVDLPAGPIPATGWNFIYTGCCRNPCTNYSGSSSQDWWLRAVMYPFPTYSPDSCWDNSPVLHEKPPTTICAGYPFTFYPNATDEENDSLSFEWTPPMTSVSTTMTGINTGYTFTSPLPGPSLNAGNIAATVDSTTGEIAFTSFTTGAFVTAYMIKAFKDGIKVAEVIREEQVVIVSCPTPANYPPVVTPPFFNPTTGLQTEFIDTVLVGTIVNFDIIANDTDLLNDNLTPQTVDLNAWGKEFGYGYAYAGSGCLIPPCAILNPVPPDSSLITLSTSFHWQTNIAHLSNYIPGGPPLHYRTYDFVFILSDNFCPVTAKSYKRVKIVVSDVGLSNPDVLAHPEEAWLGQNSPNPANFLTKIPFYLPVASHVRIAVADLFGRELKTILDEDMLSGNHETILNVDNMKAGVYFCQFEVTTDTGTKRLVKRMVIE